MDQVSRSAVDLWSISYLQQYHGTSHSGHHETNSTLYVDILHDSGKANVVSDICKVNLWDGMLDEVALAR